MSIVSRVVRSVAALSAVATLLALLMTAVRADEAGETCRRYHDHWRAGWPCCPAPWSKRSESPRECGYYVGGGAACFGDGRCCREGTWGWDYQGLFHCQRNWLGWHHGRRHQGGSGAYKTDGPKLPFCE